jgi:exonuclease VII small subunit
MLMKALLDEINQHLESRIDELKLRLGEMALEGEFEKLQAVSEQAKELERGRELVRQAERCINAAERKLETLSRSHTKASPTVLKITLRWSRLGVSGQDEVIEERMAADAMPRLFERLADRLGSAVLDRAGGVRFSDRPVISRNPTRDWVNPNNGEPYAAKPIGRSGWHVITHSSTKQKIEQIEAVARGVGFPLGSILAEAVARQSD